VDDYKVITEELRSFDPALPAKPTILVGAKADVANPDKLKKLAAMAKRRKLPFFAISAVTGEGVEPLKFAIAEMVAAHRPIELEPEVAVAAKLKPNYPPPPSSARRRG
jgi:GTP-binding protein